MIDNCLYQDPKSTDDALVYHKVGDDGATGRGFFGIGAGISDMWSQTQPCETSQMISSPEQRLIIEDQYFKDDKEGKERQKRRNISRDSVSLAETAIGLDILLKKDNATHKSMLTPLSRLQTNAVNDLGEDFIETFSGPISNLDPSISTETCASSDGEAVAILVNDTELKPSFDPDFGFRDTNISNNVMSSETKNIGANDADSTKRKRPFVSPSSKKARVNGNIDFTLHGGSKISENYPSPLCHHLTNTDDEVKIPIVIKDSSLTEDHPVLRDRQDQVRTLDAPASRSQSFPIQAAGPSFFPRRGKPDKPRVPAESGEDIFQDLSIPAPGSARPVSWPHPRLLRRSFGVSVNALTQGFEKLELLKAVEDENRL